jgi:hypothetical protein
MVDELRKTNIADVREYHRTSLKVLEKEMSLNIDLLK